jgi:hypothetical protein
MAPPVEQDSRVSLPRGVSMGGEREQQPADGQTS